MHFSDINSMFYTPTLAPINAFAQKAYLAAKKAINRQRQFKTFFGDTLQGDIGDYVQSRIYSFGVWEPNLTRFMQRKIKPDTSALDIGAHVGYFSLLMSSLAPKGNIIAIEASPKTFAQLSNHVALNRRRNITLVNKAVASEPGEVKLYNSKFGACNTGNNSLIAPHGNTPYSVVKADTIMNIIGSESERISFIKIDVEGAERPILNEILENQHKFAKSLTVVAEVSDGNLDLVDRFLEAGFKCSVLENSYGLDAYLSKEVLEPKPWAGKRHPSADLIFER